MNKHSFLFRALSIIVHQEKVTNAINHYQPNCPLLASLKLRFRVSWVYASFGWDPKEYFLYHFESLSKADRTDLVPITRWTEFLSSTFPNSSTTLVSNKWVGYLNFKEFYLRKVFRLQPESEKSANSQYDDFVSCFAAGDQLPKSLIAKPLGLCSGLGVRILDIEEYADVMSFKQVLQEYSDGAVVEELIDQDPRLAQFHPSSVNTIRINTIRFSDEVYPFLPLFRMGRGDLVVDNFHGGGIGAVVDFQTGRLGMAETLELECFECHPDTGVKVLGFEIPQWQELLQLTQKAALKFEVGTVIGWDFALTPKGWDLVEINNLPGIPLIQRHFNKEFAYMEKRYHDDISKIK